MSVVLERGQPPNFYNVFQVYDNILSLGVRPIVELSFMPSKLVICPLTGCQYAFKNPVSAYKGGADGCGLKAWAKRGLTACFSGAVSLAVVRPNFLLTVLLVLIRSHHAPP